jgi:hypothetical protein
MPAGSLLRRLGDPPKRLVKYTGSSLGLPIIFGSLGMGNQSHRETPRLDWLMASQSCRIWIKGVGGSVGTINSASEHTVPTMDLLSPLTLRMTMRLELHDRTDRLVCPKCQAEYLRIYGSIYDDVHIAGRYSADPHHHKGTAAC